MKRTIAVTIACALLLAALAGCDVFKALEITPGPSAATTAQSDPPGEPITFKDPEVEKTIRAMFGKTEGNITAAGAIAA